MARKNASSISTCSTSFTATPSLSRLSQAAQGLAVDEVDGRREPIFLDEGMPISRNKYDTLRSSDPTPAAA